MELQQTKWLNGSIGGILVLSTAIIGIGWFFDFDGNPLFWRVFLLAAMALVLGGATGFVYAMAGAEAGRFGTVFNALNGAIGALTISDLSRENSAILHGMRSISFALGLNGTIGLLLVLIPTYFFPGFVFVYVNKLLKLNLLVAKQQREFDEIAGGAKAEVQQALDPSDPTQAQQLLDADAIEKFWKPNGVVDKAHEQTLKTWMISNDLGNTSPTSFLNGSEFDAKRKQCRADLKL